MIIGLILLLIALAEFFLGVWMIFRYQRSQATLWYGLFAIATGCYVASNGLGYIGGIIPSEISERIGWAGAATATACFLAFSYSFPLAKKKFSDLLVLVAWPVFIFTTNFLFTGLLIDDTQKPNYGAGYSTSTGPFFWAFLVYFLFYWLWSAFNLFSRMLKSDGIHRWQLKMIFIGVLTSVAVASIFDIVIPLVTVAKLGYIGSLFSAVWLGLTSYILVKR